MEFIATVVDSLGPIAGLVAFGIALLTFLATQIQSSRSLTKSASAEWVSTLEKEVEFLKRKLDECERDRGVLHEEADEFRADADKARQREYRLMRRVESLEEERERR